MLDVANIQTIGNKINGRKNKETRIMIDGAYINRSILEYKQAYAMAGIEPPAYRITCKEHKALLDYLSRMPAHKTHQSMIAEYSGVRIEVVMIVDAYL